MANADLVTTVADETPQNRLLAMMLGVTSTQLIGLAAQLDIADRLNEGPKSIGALAKATARGRQRCSKSCGPCISPAHRLSRSQRVASFRPLSGFAAAFNEIPRETLAKARENEALSSCNGLHSHGYFCAQAVDRAVGITLEPQMTFLCTAL
jgi:hypothetical protein